MRSSPPRTVLALISALLVAWFAVLWRDERVGSAASARILERPEMSDSDWERSLDELRRAELLDPGTKWTVTRATSLLLRDKRAALRLAQSVLAGEPDNLGAWLVVYEATRERDPRRSARALAEIRRLDPPLPGSARRRQPTRIATASPAADTKLTIQPIHQLHGS